MGAPICDLLLECNADINSRDKDGWTPLKLATRMGETTTAEVLRGKGSTG